MDMNDNSNRVACWGEIAIRFTILMGKKSSLDVSTLDLACKQTHGSHALPLRTPGKLEVLLHQSAEILLCFYTDMEICLRYCLKMNPIKAD